MIDLIKFYLIFVLIIVTFSIVAIVLVKTAYKRYPESKFSNFLRKYVISDVDMEDYN